jgi:FtsH-binding integral membrane protein
MLDTVPRVLLALAAAILLGLVLSASRRVPRDLALAVFAVGAAVLGIFAIFGPTAAAIGGAAILATFVLGAIVYGAVALVARLAR